MTFFDHFKGLFGLSTGFWILFGVYKIFSVSRFIVKRYEKETDLLSTVFFKDHVPFVRYLPGFTSCVCYTTHLIMCTWGWRFYGKKKTFRDIRDPKQITQHFSPKEIQRVRYLYIYMLIGGLHFIALFVFRFIWPEHFS